jgi:hypothetical protein
MNGVPFYSYNKMDAIGLKRLEEALIGAVKELYSFYTATREYLFS